ncbi:MAG TPA: helix-turn-helix domain-containing protein [Burkholderiales bacterium]|nr:helix-turn-helix domain-containing protein [Burkholderiales bacterium]
MNPLPIAPQDRGFATSRLHTLDADEHAACLKEWGQCYDQLSAGRFEGWFEEYLFGNVQLFRERMNREVHETGDPWVGSRTIAVPLEVEGSGRFFGERFDIDTIITLKGGEALDFRTPPSHEILAITADAKALNAYALTVEHRDIEAELNGSHTIPATPERSARLRAFLATAMASLRETPETLQHAQTRKELEESVFGIVVRTVPESAARATRPSARARQRLVAKARDYMRAHIDEPITVADLCSALRVSRRTLQYGFHDALDLNPVRFLRAMRLNGARRELKHADPACDTVADIAARWGFWHLSHFATDYRSMFYELPSETLRRSSAGT